MKALRQKESSFDHNSRTRKLLLICQDICLKVWGGAEMEMRRGAIYLSRFMLDFQKWQTAGFAYLSPQIFLSDNNLQYCLFVWVFLQQKTNLAVMINHYIPTVWPGNFQQSHYLVLISVTQSLPLLNPYCFHSYYINISHHMWTFALHWNCQTKVIVLEGKGEKAGGKKKVQINDIILTTVMQDILTKHVLGNADMWWCCTYSNTS